MTRNTTPDVAKPFCLREVRYGLEPLAEFFPSLNPPGHKRESPKNGSVPKEGKPRATWSVQLFVVVAGQPAAL